MKLPYICSTCGTQYPSTENPPNHCPICEDERQYIGENGQLWTTMEEVQVGRKNVFTTVEPNLIEIVSVPRFAIGQRALLVQSPDGNVLWDCITLLDDATIEQIWKLGGISKIAISHPHYYSSMIEWSKAFNAPIYIHESEREWVMRPDASVQFWNTETLSFSDDLTLIRCGGHYTGSQALHWAGAADNKGVLLTGDTILVTEDRRYVTFMYSYPNRIPLSITKINRLVDALEPFSYDRLYSYRPGLELKKDAQTSVRYSAERYIRALNDQI